MAITNQTMTKQCKTSARPGYVLWEGPSPVDGQTIVAIATVESSNRKTGNMIQVWILRCDRAPHDAVKAGVDRSICGDCIHRGDGTGKGRTCYVDLSRAPLAVWTAYRRNVYGDLPGFMTYLSSRRKPRSIRWGAYGDPAMLPQRLVSLINSHDMVAGHTGYTHQWRQPWAQWARGTFQASVDGFGQYLQADEAGWRVFLVLPKHQVQQPVGVSQCPATVEASQAHCLTCRLCDGAKLHVFVVAHGSNAAAFIGAAD